MDRHVLDDRLADLALSQAGAYTASQAYAVGATPDALEHRAACGHSIRLHRSIYRLRDHPVNWQQRLWAAHLEAGPGSVVSHSAAAQIMGLPGWPRDQVEVTKMRGRHHEVTLGRLHETSWLPTHHVVAVPGYPPLTSIARCIFDLAGDPPPWARGRPRALEVHGLKVERALDHALVHLGLTIEKEAAVRAELGRRGRPGSALVRDLLTRLGPGHVPTESGLEDLFLSVIRSYGIEEPERQVVLGDETYQGRVDFLYRRQRLVVEVDGRWHDGPLEREADRWRDNRFVAMGLRPLRFVRRDLVQEPGRVARTIRCTLCIEPAELARRPSRLAR